MNQIIRHTVCHQGRPSLPGRAAIRFFLPPLGRSIRAAGVGLGGVALWATCLWTTWAWAMGCGASGGLSVGSGDLAVSRAVLGRWEPNWMGSDWQLERLEFPLYLDLETRPFVGDVEQSVVSVESDRVADVLVAGLPRVDGSLAAGSEGDVSRGSAESSARLSAVEREILESICEIYHLCGPQSRDDLWVDPAKRPLPASPSFLGSWLKRGLIWGLDGGGFERWFGQVERGSQGLVASFRGIANSSRFSAFGGWERLQSSRMAMQVPRPTVPTVPTVAGANRSVRAYPIKYSKLPAALPQVDPSDWLAPRYSRAAGQPAPAKDIFSGETPDDLSAAASGAGVPGAGGSVEGEEVQELPAAAPVRAGAGEGPGQEEQGQSDVEAPAAPIRPLERNLYWEVFERQAAELGGRLSRLGSTAGSLAADLRGHVSSWTAGVAREPWEAVGAWSEQVWSRGLPRIHESWTVVADDRLLEPEPTASYVGLESAIVDMFQSLEQAWSCWQGRGRVLLTRVARLSSVQNDTVERLVLERIDAVRR